MTVFKLVREILVIKYEFKLCFKSKWSQKDYNSFPVDIHILDWNKIGSNNNSFLPEIFGKMVWKSNWSNRYFVIVNAFIMNQKLFSGLSEDDAKLKAIRYL